MEHRNATACAELILHNGFIWTGDSEQPQVQALAIAGGKVIAVGSSDEILAVHKGDATECVDLGGDRVIPGLNDSHLHLINTGAVMEMVLLDGCRSNEELVERMKKGSAESGWIVGRGFNHEQFTDRRMPTRWDLDQVSTEIPVMAVRTCGHVAICNSKLLEMAGVAKGFGQVDGGEIRYDDKGEPTGFLAEQAMGLAYALQTTEPSREDYKRRISNAMAALIRSGLTSVHTDDLGAEQWDEKIGAYYELYSEGKLPLRINHQLRFGNPEDLLRFDAWLKEHSSVYRFDRNDFSYEVVKLMTDGSLGGRTAAMAEPYADDPSTCGVPVLTRAEMTAILSKAHELGYMLSGHAIGDKAIIDLMEAMADSVPQEKWPEARSQIIHAQITTEAMLTRMQELHLHCDVQPAFVATDAPIVAERVGEAKAKTSYAWKTMLDLGVTVSGGSDSPVESFNPFYGIFCAVTRTDAAGNPVGGWLPDQKLSVAEAVALYTTGSAYAERKETIKGRLMPGYLADCLRIDRDIFAVSPEQIKDTQVKTSWIGGKVAYSL